MTLQFACEAFVTPDEVIADGCKCAIDLNDDEALIGYAIDAASDLLTLLSDGRVHGRCTVTVRPVSTWNNCFGSVFEDGYGLHPDARFGGMDVIPLRGPRPQVISVVIDGVELNPSEYGLIDNEFLFRREGSWPSNSNLRLLPNADGVFEITMMFGFPIDLITKQAALELICELIAAGTNQAAAIAPGVTQANIQGATVVLRDQLEAGGADVGLPRLSRWFSVYGYGGAAQSGVWTPELTHGWQLVEVEGPAGS